MATAISGAAFGAAMMAAGFHQPSVVISQLKFENWHMFQVFMAATATSTIIYAVAERTGYAKLSPRSSSPLGLFSTYDGNIVGGSLLGAGMALSGSCPGTLYAQLAAGAKTGMYALGGAIVGGILWTGPVSKAVKSQREKNSVRPQPGTLPEQLGLSRNAAVVLLEVAFLAVLTATTVYSPPSPTAKVSGIVGGMFIAASQLVSLVTRKSLIGVSGSFEEAGNFFWWLAKGDAHARPKSSQNLVFAAGVAAGAWTLLQWAPTLADGPIHEVAPELAVLGGVLMAIGSRMAGGCTSGHGISGISLLSMSSVITIATTFAVGGAVAKLVY